MENLDYEEVQQTNPYTYSISGWRDQLLKYNDEEFEYDAIGNPTKYRNKTLEWSYGRLLSKYDNKIQFVYNLNGIRTAKISDFTTRFFLNGNKIIEQVDSKNSIKFYYGAEGLTGFHLTSKDNKNDDIIDSDFFYKKNAQNDIIGIYNSEGKEIAKYYYDAWGNQKIKYLVETDSNTIEYVDIGEDFDYNDISNINRFIAYKNPFRYRSYYWDFETGLYYLNSRYYDPELGRFINADAIDNIDTGNPNGFNLYMYCADNPVMFTDENGDAWWNPATWNWKKIGETVLDILTTVVVATIVIGTMALSAATGGLAGAAIGVIGMSIGFGSASGGISAIMNGTSYIGGLFGGAITGAATGISIALGMLTGAGSIGILSAVIGTTSASFIGGVLSYTIQTKLNGENLSLKDSIINGLLQTISGLFAFGTGYLIGGIGVYNVPGSLKETLRSSKSLKSFLFSNYVRNYVGSTILKAFLFWPINSFLNTLKR